MPKIPLKIVRDSREQNGFTFQEDFDPLPVVVDGTLRTGDYSLAGMRSRVCVERKNPDDLVGSLTEGRDRFESELDRMADMDAAALVIEAPESFFLAGHHRGATSGKSIIQSVRAFEVRYRLTVHFCRDRRDAEERTFDFLRHFANDRAKNKPSFMERALLREWKTAEEAST